MIFKDLNNKPWNFYKIYLLLNKIRIQSKKSNLNSIENAKMIKPKKY